MGGQDGLSDVFFFKASIRDIWVDCLLGIYCFQELSAGAGGNRQQSAEERKR